MMAGARIPGAGTPTAVEPGSPAAPFLQHASPPGPTGLDLAPDGGPSLAAPGRSGRRGRGTGPIVPPKPHHTPEGEARGMTESERDMARSLFRNSVDYSRVKVHNEEYLPFGLQPDDTAMTPNGEMYFNPKHFKEDFSLSTFMDSLWFMHEMVHVWQHQLGYPVMLRGAIRIGLGYEYTLQAGKKLADYNMEAQGNLLSDYWAVKQFGRPPRMWEIKHIGDLALYEKVLAGFIANPADKRNLPG